jgi:Cu/Zn superoxide dismutase
VARYRKTAIAVLAASALLLTPTAAYADHKHHSVSASSEDSGMSWGYYSGDVTAYTTDKVFQNAKASAVMIGMNGRSFFRLRVTGIKAEDDTTPTYGVHLHEGECIPTDDPDNPNPGPPTYGSGPHYNVNWNPLADLRDREVWLDLDVNSDGHARSTATVDFIPEGPRSIVFHADGTNPDTGLAGPRLACVTFNIERTATS